MSLSPQRFFEQLEDGEEYFTVMMYKETFNVLAGEWLEHVSFSSRIKNESFKTDIIHKGLVKVKRKANKELRDYEYLKNHQ